MMRNINYSYIPVHLNSCSLTQTDHWGSIEWAHDLDLQETLSRTSAGILFYSMHCGDMTGT